MYIQSKKDIQLEFSWLKELEDEFDKEYMLNLKSFLISEKRKGKKIFPKGKDIFRALNATPLTEVKVVIIGQDPYHGPGQAHGLCFSVPDGIPVPPSLRNIFKELEDDLDIAAPTSGNLEPWAKQGVLLLNSVLTVEQGIANSHSSRGWENFTDSIISKINQMDSIVFMLWGKYAAKKGERIDSNKHLILRSPHPSPLSAHLGFLGNGHFTKCNDYLKSQSKKPIDWSLKS